MCSNSDSVQSLVIGNLFDKIIEFVTINGEVG